MFDRKIMLILLFMISNIFLLHFDDHINFLSFVNDRCSNKFDLNKLIISFRGIAFGQSK